MSAQELAREIGTSDASIIRFAQKVGYTGLNELKYTMLKAHRVFIVGLDFNKNVAEIIAHKFMTLGLTLQALTNYDTLRLYQSPPGEDDLFITLSLSGNHKQLSSILADFKKNKSSVILISNYEKSLCATHANLTLLIPKTDLLHSSDTISREILILVLFDMLFHNFLTEDLKAYQTFQKTASYSKLSNQDDTRDGLRRLMNLL